MYSYAKHPIAWRDLQNLTSVLPRSYWHRAEQVFSLINCIRCCTMRGGFLSDIYIYIICFTKYEYIHAGCSIAMASLQWDGKKYSCLPSFDKAYYYMWQEILGTALASAGSQMDSATPKSSQVRRVLHGQNGCQLEGATCFFGKSASKHPKLPTYKSKEYTLIPRN